MNEFQAIRQMQAGDIRGLETMVGLYQLRAIRAAYLITHDAALAEDVVQDSFLRAFRSIGHFDPARPFGPWFLRSVVHAAVKAAQRAAKYSPASGTMLEDLFAPDAPVETQVEAAEFQRQVWSALQALSPRQRAVLVQRYFLDMSEREMADELSAAPGTIKWLLHTARARLRSLLSERNTK
jgi:RNA polymerase sigma-70 factor, ECF subfamily